MSVRGPKLKIFALILAIIAIVLGAYFTFFQSRGFVETTAEIVSVTERSDTVIVGDDDEKEYDVTVEYTVDGNVYSSLLDSYSPSYKVGKTVTVLYDPNDPGTIHSGRGMGVYFMIIGAIIIAVVIFTTVKSKKTEKEAKEQRESSGKVGYAPSVKGEERELYFITDTGTAKVGHRVEDKDRRIIYEAKMTKFNLLTPFAFDFIDHENGTTTPHMVGHEEASEWDTLLLDNHYTFTFDGEDIWKHLKKNGISVDSSFDGGNGRLIGINYRILRDGEEIARVQSSGVHVHEEDAETKGKMGNLVPVQGYYRIWTRERNIDLLFVTMLAFARSGASDDRGGNYGTLFGTIKKK